MQNIFYIQAIIVVCSYICGYCGCNESKQLKLGLNEQRVTLNESVEVFYINTNYLSVQINMKELSGIRTVLVSDKLNNESLIECSERAELCQSKQMLVYIKL